MPALHQPPRQVRLYCRGELLQEQLLWPGQPMTVGRQPRDHTLVLPCPELPWRAELLSPLDDGWIVRAQTPWSVMFDGEHDSPVLDDDRWVPCILGLQLKWQSYLITISQAPEQSIVTQVVVPSAQRPLRLQAPSPTICAVMVGLAFVQISSAAKIKDQPLPWSIESLSWDNPHVVEHSGRQGQQLPSIQEALKPEQPSMLERALKTATPNPEQASSIKSQSAQEPPQQLPSPTLQITASPRQVGSTPALKRWRIKPKPIPGPCAAWHCDPLLERTLGARINAKTRASAHTLRQGDPTLQGRLNVVLTMRRDADLWRVLASSSTQEERLGPALGPCIRAQLAKLSVPSQRDDAPLRSPQEISLVFVFANDATP